MRSDWLSTTRQDVMFALRYLKTAPGFTASAVLTLAVGIGASASIFSAADHVLFRALPYRDPAAVVTLWETNRAEGDRVREVSPGNFLDWRGRARSFERLGLAEPSGFDLTGDGPPLAVTAWRVTEDFLPALGTAPSLGQSFVAGDFLPGAPPTVLLSHGFWLSRFGADSSLPGRTIRLDGAPVQVRGILPPGLDYPEPADVWAPKIMRPDEPEDYASAYMHAVARLRPGVGFDQARLEMEQVASVIASERSATNRNTGIRLIPLDQQIRGAMRGPLLVLLSAVGFLVLIACTNVSLLLLARGARREQEIGVRAALGAGRGRLIRQLLVENLVLAGFGGAAGVALAWVGVRALGQLVPVELARLGSVALDARVLGFAAGVTLGSTLLFGLAPALRLSRTNLAGALVATNRTVSGSRARSVFRRTLIAMEVALALILLAGAGLLGRSFLALVGNDLGFAAENRVSVQVFLWDRNQTAEQRRHRVADIESRILRVPGVQEVGVISALPFHPHQIAASAAMVVEQQPAPANGEWPRVNTTIASPSYFRLMGIPVRRGRPLNPEDRDGAPLVAVINETLANRFFPGEDPIGRRVTIGVMGRPLSREIVGVVGDVRPTAFDSDPRPELFIPYAQDGGGSVTFIVRTGSDPGPLIPLLQAQVWEVDPEQTIYHAATLPSLLSETLQTRKFYLILIALFAGVALGLAAIGVHGLVSFATTERRREIGVRVALGAERGDVERMIIRQGFAVTVPGIIVGVAGALALTRFLGTMLYGVRPIDPPTFALVATVMIAVSGLAAYLPARRASSVDPAQVLKEQ